jgi:hypothetical protein
VTKTFWIPTGSERPLEELPRLDSEAFAEMRAALDAQRPELRAEIDSKIERALEIVRSFDPLPLLVHVAMKHGISAPGQEEPHAGSAPTIRIEYALSLALVASDDTPRGEAPPGVVVEFEELVGAILDLTTMYYATEGTAEGKYSLDEAELRALSLMYMLNVRGEARRDHALTVFRAVMEPHDGFLRDRLGFTTSEFLETVLELERQIVAAFDTYRDAMRIQATIDSEFDTWCEGDGQLIPEAMQEKTFAEQSDIRNRVAEAMRLVKQLPPSPFEIVPNERTSAAVLREISSSFGDNRAFAEVSGGKAMPTSDSVIAERPLLRRGNRYFGFGIAALLDSLTSVLEAAIHRTDDKYWQQSYTKKRAAVLEELACGLLSRLLPEAQIYRNVYFQAPGVPRFETDAIVVFGRTVLILETKAGALARSARRGGLEAIRKDIKLLIKSAHDQARRVTDVIAGGGASFTYANGSPAVTLPARADLRDLFFVNVTLANLGHLATRLSTVKRLDLLSSDDWPWSVCITDLQVIAEILDGPGEFLAYLSARRTSNDAGGAVTPDENDFLMAFLRDGLAELKEAHERGAPVLMTNETEELDSYYAMKEGFIDDAPKPALRVPIELAALFRGLEALGPDGAELVADILALPFRAIRFLGEQIAERIASVRAGGAWSEVTVPPGHVAFGLTIAVGRIANAEEWAPRIRYYVTVKKYHQKASRWIAIGIGIDDDGHLEYPAYQIVGEWKQNDALAREATKSFGTPTHDAQP